ncbi:MAG: hypothetical protein CM15mP120_28540 [Pseudomonadota bacterium]|nr:MAG: hypothetical protein CM15mP120_28540 [Pseudomonadota bacterium]
MYAQFWQHIFCHCWLCIEANGAEAAQTWANGLQTSRANPKATIPASCALLQRANAALQWLIPTIWGGSGLDKPQIARSQKN